MPFQPLSSSLSLYLKVICLLSSMFQMVVLKIWSETQTASGDFLDELFVRACVSVLVYVCVCVCAHCTLWSVFSCYSDIFLSFLYNNVLLLLLRCNRIFSLTEYPEYLIACTAVKSRKALLPLYLMTASMCKVLHIILDLTKSCKCDHYRHQTTPTPTPNPYSIFITTAEMCCISSAMNTSSCLWQPVQIIAV